MLSLSRIRTGLAAATVLAITGPASAAIISQWNFNGTSSTTVPGGTNAPTPSVGTGAASLIGGTTATFASGISNGGSTDPETTNPPNFGWGTTTYPAQGTNNQSAGVRFDVSTAGQSSVYVYWDQRHSNTSSRFAQFQYTLDGSVANPTWVDGPSALFSGPAGDTWFLQRQVDLTGISGVANNPNFAFRVVSTFDGSGAYAPSNSSSTYAGTGTWRFDMVTVATTPVPEPATGVLLCGLGMALLHRTRRRA